MELGCDIKVKRRVEEPVAGSERFNPLSTAAQIALALAGFAGVVVAFRSSSLHEVAPGLSIACGFYWAAPWSPLFCSACLLLTIKATWFPIWRCCSGFSLLLTCIFGFLSRRRQSELGLAVIKEMGCLPLSLLCDRHPGDGSWPVVGLQCSALGVFWLFYAAIVFQLAIGTLQFARMILRCRTRARLIVFAGNGNAVTSNI